MHVRISDERLVYIGDKDVGIIEDGSEHLLYAEVVFSEHNQSWDLFRGGWDECVDKLNKIYIHLRADRKECDIR